MNDFTVKVWGVSTDGTELISGKDAQAIITLLSSEIQAITKHNHALVAQVEALKGLKPQLPPCPPLGRGLPRYGLRWNGEFSPLSIPMDDGYWTPFHLVQKYLAENRAEIVKDFAEALAQEFQCGMSGGDVFSFSLKYTAKMLKGEVKP